MLGTMYYIFTLVFSTSIEKEEGYGVDLVVGRCGCGGCRWLE